MSTIELASRLGWQVVDRPYGASPDGVDIWLEIATAYASPMRSSGGLECIVGPGVADDRKVPWGSGQGTLSNAVIDEKKNPL
jgi:hypothetical protein